MTDKIISKIISFSRKHFRNSWIHKIPVTSWIYKKLYLHTVKEKERKLTFMGVRLLVPTRDTTIIPSIIDQTYETYELNLFKKLAEKSSVVFDIGANIGLYSLVTANLKGPKNKIYAFEPIEENQYYIEHNIKLNKFKNIKLIPMAVGDKESKLKIYLANNSIGTHSAGKVTSNSVEIDQTTIDSFSKQENVVPDLIKMDIEGYEAYAINGGINTLKKHKPTLLIEFDTRLIKSCGSDPQKLAAQLDEIYPFKFLINEKKQKLEKISDIRSLSKTFNINLLFSDKNIKY